MVQAAGVLCKEGYAFKSLSMPRLVPTFLSNLQISASRFLTDKLRISWRCSSVSREGRFDFMSFIFEKVRSETYVMPNTVIIGW